MRIVGGKWRSRSLQTPRTGHTRPILDRVKTSVFDRLGARLAVPGSLPPINVLDLFAGSGALGLEALSRGARHCCFVERSRAALQALQANITALSCGRISSVLSADAMRLDIRCPWDGGYDLCFLDPPYRYLRDDTARRQLEALLNRLADSPQVNDSALILFRCPSDVDSVAAIRHTALVDRQTYGRMTVWWWQVTHGPHRGSDSDGQTDSA